jgi:hypothetical protein
VSKNQVLFEVGNSTLKPLDRGECNTTAAQSIFVAKSVVGTNYNLFSLQIFLVDFWEKNVPIIVFGVKFQYEMP